MKRAFFTILAIGLVIPAVPQSDDDQVNRVIKKAHERQSTQNDLWFKNGDFPRSIQNLRFMNATDPSDYEVVTSLGWLLFSTENYSEEWATYTRFERMNPQMPDGALPLGEMLFNRKVWSQIPPLLEPRLARFENKLHANNFRFLGLAYQRLGDYGQAVRVFEIAVRVHPEDVNLKRNLENARSLLANPTPPASQGNPR
ncbi:MAG: hypothetical protein KF812_04620 [Fimbriimonadaceae bacterium]|nr:hypothetical protein [Fimbriimonadaceae bacterium]